MPLDTAALWELGWLREQGVLTEEEFKEQKARVLQQQWILADGAASSQAALAEVAHAERTTLVQHPDEQAEYRQRAPRQSSHMRSRSAQPTLVEAARQEPINPAFTALTLDQEKSQNALQEKQRRQEERRREEAQRRTEQEQQKQLEERRRNEALRQRQEQQRLERERLNRERQEQINLQEHVAFDEEQQRLQRQRWREEEEERQRHEEQARRSAPAPTPTPIPGVSPSAVADAATQPRSHSARRSVTPPPRVAVPHSPESGAGSASPGVLRAQTLSSASSSRFHAGGTPRSRSFERPAARQMLTSVSTTSPLRSPSQLTASPPTPRFGLTFGPDSTASPAIVRKAEGQLRLDVHAAAQAARKQLVKVQNLLPVVEEAASQAVAATQIAASALRANPRLKNPATNAAAFNSEAVRHALRALANAGDNSTYSMERRVAELQQCAEQLSAIVEELETMMPAGAVPPGAKPFHMSSTASGRQNATALRSPTFERYGEHSSLTPGTLSSDHAFPLHHDTLVTLVTPTASVAHDNLRLSMGDAVQRAQHNVRTAQDVCKFAVEQLRIVRTALINTRGQVQVAQAKMASDRLGRLRFDPTANPATVSPNKTRAPYTADIGPYVDGRSPVTGAGARWPQPSASPPERKGVAVGRQFARI